MSDDHGEKEFMALMTRLGQCIEDKDLTTTLTLSELCILWNGYNYLASKGLALAAEVENLTKQLKVVEVAL